MDFNLTFRSIEGRLDIQQKTIPAGAIYEMHRHDFIEIEFILSGRAEHIYNSEVGELSRGHAYIVTHHDLHAFRALHDTELINLSFDVSLLDEELISALSYHTGRKLCCVFDEDTGRILHQQFCSLMREQNDPDALGDVLSRALIAEIVVYILRHAGSVSAPEPTLSGKVLERIHTDFREPLSLDTLARSFSVTPNYLGRVFSRDIGQTFNHYLCQTRLRCACNLLLFSNLPAHEIAQMSGFGSVEYFFYSFKKNLGTTPQSYRLAGARRLSTSSVSVNTILRQ